MKLNNKIRIGSLRIFFKKYTDSQFTVFLAILLALHIFYTSFGWDGKIVWLIIIPFIFALVNFLGFVYSGFNNSIWELKYILALLLYFMVSLKVGFVYYNILFSVFLVVLGIYAFKHQSIKIKKLRSRLILLMSLNILLIAIPDKLVLKYIQASDIQIWGEKLKWDDFQGTKPERIGEMDACIDSDIFWKNNRVYNLIGNITLAVTRKSSSWVRPEYAEFKSNLLIHEQLHFDITEWTRRELQDSLNKRRNINLAREIFDYFQIIELNRQIEYDSISQHGIDFIGQIIWNKKVNSMLK